MKICATSTSAEAQPEHAKSGLEDTGTTSRLPVMSTMRPQLVGKGGQLIWKALNRRWASGSSLEHAAVTSGDGKMITITVSFPTNEIITVTVSFPTADEGSHHKQHFSLFIPLF